jgi:hypothetical protein
MRITDEEENEINSFTITYLHECKMCQIKVRNITCTFEVKKEEDILKRAMRKIEYMRMQAYIHKDSKQERIFIQGATETQT